MAILTVTSPFTDGDQVTSTKLNNLVAAATFAAGSVADATLSIDGGGGLKVGTIQTGNIAASSITTAKIADSTGASDGVTTAKLATGAVTTAKITDANVTTAKIADSNVTAAKLSGAQTGDAPIFGCRAWVNFDATKNAAGSVDSSNTNRKINDSGNVTSVLKNATGDYTITFSTALPNANFATVVTSDNTGVSSASYDMGIGIDAGTAQTTTTVRLKTYGSGPSGTVSDKSRVCVVVFG